ncbi:MAG TPA: ParB/RepB/Spo0J family partition protein [Sphingobium sp.]|nr:ParB/RepB/Spo0J family partition protein [Sphingobium sp.]
MSEGETATRGNTRRLGRGLSALLGEATREIAISQESGGDDSAGTASNRAIQLLEIARVAPHPDQPRRHFDEQALDELAESIRARGIIQPIIVRSTRDGCYQIVAGERRWRAAQKAQLHQIPAIVRDFSETETLEIALVENIQREDLNPIEEAQAYRRLIDHFQHSQDGLARIVGKSRSHVANLMRLLDLPADVQSLVMDGRLSMGHGRALIGVPGCTALAREIADKGLSVRDTEKLVRAVRVTGEPPQAASTGPSAGQSGRDADLVAMEQQLSDLLGLKVGISFESGKGALTLHYSSLDQLDMLCQKLTGGGF